MDTEQIHQRLKARRRAIDGKLDLIAASVSASKRRVTPIVVGAVAAMAVAWIVVRRRRASKRRRAAHTARAGQVVPFAARQRRPAAGARAARG